MYARGRTMRICLSALLLVLGGHSQASAAPGTTERISVASDGTQGNSGSYGPSISADGRYVAFESYASNLIVGDTNGSRDVFVHDRQTGCTELVSVAYNGTQGNNASGVPFISADGRYVAFESFASNLVAGDSNDFCSVDDDGLYDDNCADIFVRDRVTGQTERVSVASSGTQGRSNSYGPHSISADGRFVAFESFADLVPFCAAVDVFVHDRLTGQTTLASLAPDGTGGNSVSFSPSISADGHYVAFQSFASNLVAGDTNGCDVDRDGVFDHNCGDIFVHDQQTGETDRVSVAWDGTQGNEQSWMPSLSADGRYVAFRSRASNLVGGDTNGYDDIFVHDRLTGQTTRVSVASDGTQGDTETEWPSISADGRHVAFVSWDSNLVSGDTNGSRDVFVHDRQTGQTTRVSVTSDGTPANDDSWTSSISTDGRYVAFDSDASNLVSGDTNDDRDVFVHDRAADPTPRPTAEPQPTAEPSANFDLVLTDVYFADAYRPYEPQYLQIGAGVRNAGPDTAPGPVTVAFYLGTTAPEYLIGTYELGDVPPGAVSYDGRWLQTPFVTYTLPSTVWEDQTVVARVRAAVAEQDLSDNEESQRVSVYRTDFRMNEDAFSFHNPQLSWAVFKDEFDRNVEHLLLGPLPSIVSLVRLLASGQGHCYGMASASVSYYVDRYTKPVDPSILTYAMSETDPAVIRDIRDRHFAQVVLNLLPLVRSTYYGSAASVYQKVEGAIRNGSPIILTLGSVPDQGDHAVTAYKIIKELAPDGSPQRAVVLTHDSNLPLPEHIVNMMQPSVEFHQLSGEGSISGLGYWLGWGRGSAHPLYDSFHYVQAEMPGDVATRTASLARSEQASSSQQDDEMRQALLDIQDYLIEQLAIKDQILVSSGSSAARLLVTDAQGRRAGWVGAQIVSEIPSADVRASEDAEVTLVYLPATGDYTVTSAGIEDGAFDLYVAKPENVVRALVRTYEGIATTSTSLATLTLDSGDPVGLVQNDLDGNGTADVTVAVTQEEVAERTAPLVTYLPAVMRR